MRHLQAKLVVRIIGLLRVLPVVIFMLSHLLILKQYPSTIFWHLIQRSQRCWSHTSCGRAMDVVNNLSVYKCHPVSELNSTQFMSVYSIDVRRDSYIPPNQCAECQKICKIPIDRNQVLHRKLCLKSSEKLESRNKGCWTVLRRKFDLISRIIFSRQMQDLEEGEESKLPQPRFVKLTFFSSHKCSLCNFQIFKRVSFNWG